MRRTLYFIPILALVWFSCVEKLDVNSFPEVPPTDQERIEYIPMLPEWSGFNSPQDVHVGYDELIYVADTENDRIVMLDLNGTVLGVSQRIEKPVAIAQDRKLDLLVVGRKDTVLGGTPIQLSAVFRLNLVAVGHRIDLAEPVPVILHPTYILGRSFRQSDSTVYFTGIAAMADNQYYITRTGPSNDFITQAGGPDNNILWFGSNDTLITPLTAYLTATGTGKASANGLTSITTYAVPPQRADVDQRRSFIVSLKGLNSFRVQGMMYFATEEEAGFIPEPAFEIIDTSAAERFLYFCSIESGRPGGCFVEPEDVTFGADNRYIFAVDAETDSVYQFASNGFEGVRPPSYSSQRKNIIVSFGGSGSGTGQFNRPHGVAYYQDYEILLVADTGNNRIVRFRLSTDFE
jgi:hypothetical protein